VHVQGGHHLASIFVIKESLVRTLGKEVRSVFEVVWMQRVSMSLVTLHNEQLAIISLNKPLDVQLYLFWVEH